MTKVSPVGRKQGFPLRKFPTSPCKHFLRSCNTRKRSNRWRYGRGLFHYSICQLLCSHSKRYRGLWYPIWEGIGVHPQFSRPQKPPSWATAPVVARRATREMMSFMFGNGWCRIGLGFFGLKEDRNRGLSMTVGLLSIEGAGLWSGETCPK